MDFPFARITQIALNITRGTLTMWNFDMICEMMFSLGIICIQMMLPNEPAVVTANPHALPLKPRNSLHPSDVLYMYCCASSYPSLPLSLWRQCHHHHPHPARTSPPSIPIPNSREVIIIKSRCSRVCKSVEMREGARVRGVDYRNREMKKKCSMQHGICYRSSPTCNLEIKRRLLLIRHIILS